MTNSERLAALEAHMQNTKEHIADANKSMAEFAEQTTDILQDIQKRLQKMDLNGHAIALKRLAESEPGLTKLANKADALINVADRAEATEVTRRTLGRWFHLRTLSKFVYAAIGGGILVFAIEIALHLLPVAK